MNRFVVRLISVSLLAGCTASEVMVRPSSKNIQVGNNPREKALFKLAQLLRNMVVVAVFTDFKEISRAQ